MRPIVIDGKIFFDMYIDVRLSHLNKDYLLTYLLSVVCGSVSHVHKLHKKDKPVNLSFERADSNGPNEPCILDGVEIPHEKGQFWGLSGQLKNIGSQCCACGTLRSKKSITATAGLR